MIFAFGAFAAPASYAQTAQTVPSNWSLIPAGLASGDSFRLLFVTSHRTNATSPEIATYNTFVQGSANGDHGSGSHSAIQDFSSEFRALISTPTVDARDNTATNTDTGSDTDAPIYWLGGEQVAGAYTYFYDGEWDSRAGRNQVGNTIDPNNIWTGSDSDGTKDDTNSAGNATSPQTTRTGDLEANEEIRDTLLTSTNPRHLYALSPILTVSSALLIDTRTIPAPASAYTYPADTAITPLTLPPASGGTGTPTYTLTPASSIPTGLNFNSATRTLSGTPATVTAATTATLIYTVTDGATPTPETASLTFTVTVETATPIFGTTIPDQTYYTGNSVDFTLPPASGGTTPRTYTLTPDVSSLGLAFAPATRALSGTPTDVTAATTLIYTVTDDAATPNTASLTFSVEVLAPSAPTAAPTNVMLLPSDREILVSWTRVDDANNGGRIITDYTATAIGGANTFCSSSGGSACLITGLTNDTQYSVTVVATNMIGTSDELSTPVIATPRAAPANTPPTAQTVPADFALKPAEVAAGGSFPPAVCNHRHHYRRVKPYFLIQHLCADQRKRRP